MLNGTILGRVLSARALTGPAWTEAGKQSSGSGSFTTAVITYDATSQVRTGVRVREINMVLGALRMRPQSQPLIW